jgi:1-acyl-sn-glycerol-3-phosphate acyltransferase
MASIRSTLVPVRRAAANREPNVPLIILRSAIFHLAFYLNCIFWFLAAMLAWPFPSRIMMMFARGWAKTSIVLHEIITGSRVEFRGLERIPAGPLLVAAKHYSAWETMALLLFFPKATYILKRELLRTPLFGWHLLKAEQIPIDRGQRARALAKMLAHAKGAIERGRQIIIFPEGPRRKVGAEPDYKFGVARLYKRLGVPCVPVAMTSGLAWPRNTLLHYPRPVLVEFLEPIPAGLDPNDFFARVQETIELNTNRLLAEAGYGGDGSSRSAATSQDRA